MHTANSARTVFRPDFVNTPRQGPTLQVADELFSATGSYQGTP